MKTGLSQLFFEIASETVCAFENVTTGISNYSVQKTAGMS